MSLKADIVEHTPPTALSPCDEGSITGLARNAVEASVLSGCFVEPPFFPETTTLGKPSACFVCIKTRARELRGCIGTVEPEHATLAAEVIANAVKAATRDPRFSPVSGDELPSLLYSVDVLGSPEHATLAAEVIANAVKAATRDPRFSPVSGDELPSLLYSVDVLGSLEPTCFEDRSEEHTSELQ